MPSPLVYVSVGTKIVEPLSVRVNQAWDTPCDEWTVEFALNGKPNPHKFNEKVRIVVDNQPMITGLLESMSVANGRVRISGRDMLAPALDAGIPSNFSWKQGEPLSSVCTQILGLAGLTYSSTENLAKPQEKSECKPPKTIRQALDDVLSVNALWAKASADGFSIAIVKPSFSGAPKATYTIAVNNSNVLSADYSYDVADQPTIILAQGSCAGKGKKRKETRAVMVNELIGSTGAAATKPAWLGAVRIPPRTGLLPFAARFNEVAPPEKPIYLEDKETKNQAELETFVKRYMAKLTARAFQLRISVHGPGFPPNTMVQVEDSYNQFAGALWVSERSFSQSASGTVSDMTLLLPYSMEL